MSGYHEIESADRRVKELRSAYLREHGWKSTSSTPGSIWMWRRSFSDVNDRRREEHDAYYNRTSSHHDHHPYPDEMLVDTETAVRMTWCEIDPARLEIDLED